MAKTLANDLNDCVDPNLDSYSGLIDLAVGFPVDMDPVLFAPPRIAGERAQRGEMS